MKRFIIAGAVFALSAAAITAAGTDDAEVNTGSDGTPNAPVLLSGHLVDGEWLASAVGAENLIILDAARKPDEYESGHIPGARFADRGAFWAEVDGIPGMFPGVDTVVPWLERLGVSNDSAVVIYDAGAGLWAARVAWTLAYLGHEEWAVLDGGYAAWNADEFPQEAGDDPGASIAGRFVPVIRDELLVDGDAILGRLNDPGFVIVDTRSSGEYDGSDVRAARGGHIPGALPLEWTLNNRSGGIPTYLPADELAEFYIAEGVVPDQSIVTLCQTGVRGAHTWLALTLAGYEDVALYDGSWADWAANDAYPVE